MGYGRKEGMYHTGHQIQDITWASSHAMINVMFIQLVTNSKRMKIWGGVQVLVMIVSSLLIFIDVDHTQPEVIIFTLIDLLFIQTVKFAFIMRIFHIINSELEQIFFSTSQMELMKKLKSNTSMIIDHIDEGIALFDK